MTSKCLECLCKWHTVCSFVKQSILVFETVSLKAKFLQNFFLASVYPKLCPRELVYTWCILVWTHSVWTNEFVRKVGIFWACMRVIICNRTKLKWNNPHKNTHRVLKDSKANGKALGKQKRKLNHINSDNLIQLCCAQVR